MQRAEKQCFCDSKSTPISSERRADVCLLARGVPARHNSATAGWRLAAAELCGSCRLPRWSLSVSVARAVINHGRVGELSGPPRSTTTLCAPRSEWEDYRAHDVRPENHRSETMPHNSSGSPRPVNVDAGKINRVMRNRGLICAWEWHKHVFAGVEHQ